MKKLLILVAALAVYNVNILAEGDVSTLENVGSKAVNVAKAVKSSKSHYCKCNNNTLETVSCASACFNNGWSGRSTLTPEGVMCECNPSKKAKPGTQGDFEKESCSSLGRCVKSGFSGQVYSVQSGKFEQVPAKK